MRHHWLNSANLWLWGIRGAEDQKEMSSSAAKNSLSSGGRFQYPSPIGDAGICYHQRENSAGHEYRLGADLRMDYAIGLWLEASASYLMEISSRSITRRWQALEADYVLT